MMKHFLTENLTENLTEKTTNFSRIQSRFYGTSAATSLTGSPVFWPLLLLLSACGGGGGGGGGGGPTTSGTATAGLSSHIVKTGRVYDGPIAGAEIYVDVDNDGVLNKAVDKLVGRSGAGGKFNARIPREYENKRYIVDLTKAMDLGADGQVGGNGENEDLSMREYGVWLAPEGATVISALTHLMATNVLTLAEINSALPGFNPLKDNPYGPAITTQQEDAFEQARAALPRLTAVIQANQAAIEKNAHNIRTNTDNIQDLKNQIAALRQKFNEIVEKPEINSGGTGTDIGETAAIETQIYDASARVGVRSTGTITFSLKQDIPNYLTINQSTGAVTLSRKVDLDADGSKAHEASRIVTFTVVAKDSANRQIAEKKVSFTITNVDEKPTAMDVTPTAVNASFAESKNKAGGLELARVTFTDPDNPELSGQNNGVMLTVASGSHSLSASDFEFRGGKIYLKADADTSVNSTVKVTVTVTPNTSGVGDKLAAQSFTFTITNDAPVSVPTPPLVVNAKPDAVDDNGGPANEGATILGNVRTNDNDAETANASLTVTGVWTGNSTTGTAGTVGQVLQGTYGRLTLKADGSYSYTAGTNAVRGVNDVFTYRIADANGGTDTATLTIRVNGEDEVDAPVQNPQPAPVFSTPDIASSNFKENAAISGKVVYDANATVGDGSTGAITYSLKPGSENYLTINQSTGAVTLNRKIDLDAVGDKAHEASRTVTFTVVATDTVNRQSTEQTVSFIITNSDDLPTGTPSVTRTVTNGIVTYGVNIDNIVDPDGPLLIRKIRWFDSLDRNSLIEVGNNSTYTPDTEHDYVVSFNLYDAVSNRSYEKLVKFNFALQQGEALPNPPYVIEKSIPSGLSAITETPNDTVTSGPMNTGHVFSVEDVVDFFGMARGPQKTKSFTIMSKTKDGVFVVDDRFTIRSDGNLSVKRGQQLDFESPHNPNGLIELKIYVENIDRTKTSESIFVNIQLINDPADDVQPTTQQPDDVQPTTNNLYFLVDNTFTYFNVAGNHLGPIYDVVAQLLLSSGPARITNKANAGQNLSGTKTDVSIVGFEIANGGNAVDIEFQVSRALNREKVQLELDSGRDVNAFIFVIVDGELHVQFKTPPNFANPHDFGANNVYGFRIVSETALPNSGPYKTTDVNVSVHNPPSQGGDTPTPAPTTTDNLQLGQTNADRFVYDMPENTKVIQSFTATNVREMVGLSLPAGHAEKIRVLSDTTLLLEFIPLNSGPNIQHVVSLHNFSSQFSAPTALVQFAQRGLYGNSIDLEFRTAPDYEAPFQAGEIQTHNIQYFKLALSPVGADGQIGKATVSKTLKVQITNDKSDDAFAAENDQDVKELTFDDGGRKLILTSNSEPFEANLGAHTVTDIIPRPDEANETRVDIKGSGEDAVLKTYIIVLSGPDALKFKVVKGHDGIYVMFKSRPNFRAPEDVGEDNTYEFTYKVYQNGKDNPLYSQIYKVTITDAAAGGAAPQDNPRSAGQGQSTQVFDFSEPLDDPLPLDDASFDISPYIL